MIDFCFTPDSTEQECDDAIEGLHELKKAIRINNARKFQRGFQRFHEENFHDSNINTFKTAWQRKNGDEEQKTKI